MKARMSSLQRTAMLWSLLAILVTAGFPSATNLFSEARFRTFSDDRGRVEGLLDRAGEETTLSEWENAVRTGRDALRGEWEREADRAIEEELREQGDTPELRTELAAARDSACAAWEGALADEITRERGTWYARLQDMAVPQVDRQALARALRDATSSTDSLTGNERITAWDALVDPEAAGLTALWEERLGTLLASARQAGNVLDEESRAAYDREIEAIEAELRREFYLEKNSLLYRERNSVVWDSLYDSSSLRYESEQDRADRVTETILNETRESLTAEEERIFARNNVAVDGSGELDFSGLGDDWEAQLRDLIERGLEKWNKAQETLFNEMTAWKESAENAYDEGDRIWQEAYEKLCRARDDWYQTITAEINDGIEKWKQKEEELDANLGISGDDLEQYFAVLNEQWASHSSSLADIALSGSQSFGQAVDNVEWLTRMRDLYAGTGVYTDAEGISSFTDTRGSLYYRLIDEGIIQPYGGGADESLFVAPKLDSVTATEDAEGNLTVTEHYTLTISRYKAGMACDAMTSTVSYTNVINEDTPEDRKSNYYFYEKELRRWQRSRDTLDALVEEAEDYAHNRNMEGINGPGFLRNIYSLYGLNPEGENDPYLMTDAEKNYELARREKEYWEQRLTIARDVMKYAFPDEYADDNEYLVNGIREGAEVTVNRKEDTETAMNEAKAAYEAELRGVQSIVTEMQRIQGGKPADGTAEDSPEWLEYSQSIGYLSEQLSEKKRLLDEAGEKYAQFRQAMILLENGEGAEFMLRELQELQDALGASEKTLREKREEYFSRMWEAERVDRLGAYAELCDEAIHSRERAKRSWYGFKTIVAGEETDAHLAAWMNALRGDAVKAEIWGESTAEISALTALYDRWQNASGEERDAARDSFAKALRDEYGRIESAWKTADETYRLLTDTTFDPGVYTGGSEGRKGEIIAAEYGRYASQSEAAFGKILSAMDSLEGDDRSYGKLLAALQEGTGRYRYGEDNSAFLTGNAAYRWAADMLEGITGDNWTAYREMVGGKRDVAGYIRELYSDYEGFGEYIGQYRAEADSGNERARILLREYYTPGRSLELLEYISEYDTAAVTALETFSATLGYVYEHEGTFYQSEAEVTGTDYAAELFAYINGHAASGITFSEETLSSLTGEELREMSGIAVAYLASLREEGRDVPSSMYSIISELESAGNELDELLYVQEHAGDGSYAAVLAQAAQDRAVAAAASEFADRVLGMYDGEAVTDAAFAFTDARYRGLSAVLQLYDGLDEAVKTYCDGTYTEGPVREFLDGLGELRETQYAFEAAARANEYVLSGGGLPSGEFVNARCAGWSDARKQELAADLASIREKIIYRSAYTGGSITAYCDERRTAAGLSDDAYREMSEYALVDYYMGLGEQGVPAWGDAADEFSDFSRFYYYENYLMGRTGEYEDAADKSAFLDEAVADYIASGGDTVDPARGAMYREFGEAFFTGDRSSMDYLPEEVKIYLYQRDYYETMFSRGTALYGEEALAAYLLSEYGGGVVEGAAREALASYIDDLNVIDRYYGDDFEDYIAPLGAFEKTMMYRYRHFAAAGEGEESLMPGFDLGVYSVEGRQALNEELWGRIIAEKTAALGGLCADMQEALHGTLRERTVALAKAERLAEFNEHPERFTSYRNCVLPLTEAPAEGEAVPLHGTMVMDAGAVIDGRDENGVINSVMYAGADDRGRMLGSMIIEAANGLYQLLRELVSASKGETADALASGTIAGFIADLRGVYDPDAAHGYTAGTGYDFDSALENLMADVRTRQADRGGSTLESLGSEVQSLASVLSNKKESLGNQSGVYALLKESGQGEMRARMEAEGAAHREIQDAFDETSAKLREAQEQYAAVNSRYIETMNRAASLHADFAAKECAYERAYAVWEYANTPYLMETSEHETGLGAGTLPGTEGDTVTDLSAVPVPDARENYLRILGEFETARAAFQYAAEQKETQETVESLNEDTVYGDLKDSFSRKAESYARVARAAVLIGETTADLERQLAEWTAKYAQYKDAPGGFTRTEEGAAELTDEEIRRRDVILAHMADYANKNGGVNAYVDFILLNANSLTPEIQGDMDFLQAHGMNYTLIENMRANYQAYLVWWDGYQQADSNADTRNPYRRRKWKRIRDDRERKYKMYLSRYESDRAQLVKYLSNIFNARNSLVATESKLRDLDEVRYAGKLSDEDTTSRNIRDSVLTRDEYELTSGDIRHIYDATDTGFPVDSESVNITSLRRKVLRKDVDGYAVMAEKGQESGTWYMYVLNAEGVRTGEKYALGDSSFMLSSDENGNSLVGAGGLGEGERAYFIDYVYSAANVAQVIKDSYGVQRDNARDEYDRYCEESVANRRHDNTVVLRDREALWYGLLEQAASVGKTSGDLKSRFYEGYEKAVNELISDGNGTSVDDRILQSLISQNSAFQQQVWQHQKMKFSERKDRWMEEVAFIRNRGERDWTNQLNKFTNLWKRWRYDTRQRISEGEEDWQQSARDLNAKMAAWRQATATSSADESMRLTWEEMESVINASIQSVNRSLPAAMRIDFDTDTLLRDTMASVPQGIGVLGNTVNTVDTTAGFAEMLNLGLSPALSARYREEMDNFEQGMKVMQNLRMTDMLFSMMDSFSTQFAEANLNVYDNVMSGLAYQYSAPFQRGSGNWSLEVVRSHSLVSTKYRTLRFTDYRDYINTTVLMKPLKSISGGEIDFTRPETYRNINADDFETYVKLEARHLEKEIERVFEQDEPEEAQDSGGGEDEEFNYVYYTPAMAGQFIRFSDHVNYEMTRLYNEFTNSYIEYEEGLAMLGMGWYRTPMVPGGPDPMTAAKIGACFAGPWTAFAVNAALLVVDVADGTTSYKHAGVQMGVSFVGSATGMGPLVNMAASGIDYEADGSVGWDNDKFKQGIKRGVVRAAVSAMVETVLPGSNTAVGYGVSEGVTTYTTNSLTAGDGWSLGWDGGNWQQHLGEGISSGVSAAVFHDPDNERESDMFRDKVISGAIDNAVMLGANYLTGGRAGNSQVNWNAMASDAGDLGGFLGAQARSYMLNRYQINGKTGERRPGAGENDKWYDVLGTGFFEYAGKATNMVKNGLKDAGEWVRNTAGDFADSTVNLFRYGEFATDDSDVIKELKLQEARDTIGNLIGNINNNTNQIDIAGEGGVNGLKGLLKQNVIPIEIAVKLLKEKGLLADEVTDPNSIGQSGDIDKGLGKVLQNLFNVIRGDPDKFKFNERLKNSYNALVQRKSDLLNEQERINIKSDSNNRLKFIQNELTEYTPIIRDIEQRMAVFSDVRKYILNAKDVKSLAYETRKSLCCTLAFWAYGVATGNESRQFPEFFMQELQLGTIGSKTNAYWTNWGGWAEKYGMKQMYHRTDKIIPNTDDLYVYNPMTSRDIDRLNQSGKEYALIWKDKRGTPMPRGNHYALIKKHSDGRWYDYDNNRDKIRTVVFRRVYKIFY